MAEYFQSYMSRNGDKMAGVQISGNEIPSR